MFHETISKMSTEKRMAFDRKKRYKTLNEVKLIKSIHKASQNFQGKSCMQKEVPLSCKLWDHKYEQQNPFDFKEIFRDPTKKLPGHLNLPNLHHIE